MNGYCWNINKAHYNMLMVGIPNYSDDSDELIYCTKCGAVLHTDKEKIDFTPRDVYEYLVEVYKDVYGVRTANIYAVQSTFTIFNLFKSDKLDSGNPIYYLYGRRFNMYLRRKEMKGRSNV